jgi:hypothetical protein
MEIQCQSDYLFAYEAVNLFAIKQSEMKLRKKRVSKELSPLLVFESFESVISFLSLIRPRIAGNVLRLCEEADFEALNCQ